MSRNLSRVHRGSVGNASRISALALFLGGFQHDPDDKGHQGAGGRGGDDAPAPGKIAEADGEQRHGDELPRRCAGIGDAGGEPAVFLEELGKGRRDEMHVGGGKAHPGDEAVANDENGGDGHDGEGQQPGSDQQKAGHQHDAGAEAVRQIAGDGRAKSPP